MASSNYCYERNRVPLFVILSRAWQGHLLGSLSAVKVIFNRLNYQINEGGRRWTKYSGAKGIVLKGNVSKDSGSWSSGLKGNVSKDSGLGLVNLRL